MNNQKTIISFAFLTGIFTALFVIFTFFPDSIHVATLPDGSIYDGDMKNGKFSGSGKLTRSDGTRYEGEFLNGQFHGKGTLVNPFSSTYTGEFKNGKMSGSGTIFYSFDRKYVGEVQNGFYHGKGIFHANGSTYEGDYDNNQLTKGIFKNEDGTRYEGEFKNWSFDGEGILIESNGDKLKGIFSQGELQGEGEFWGVDGSHYKGEFYYGSFEGKGIRTLKNGDIYEGEFKYGEYSGQGILSIAAPNKTLKKRSGTWSYGELINSDNGEIITSPESLNEIALYNQNELLKKAWDNIEFNDPTKTELYFMGISGDGTQAVFRREVEFIENQFNDQFSTKGKSITLINSRDTVEDTALASKTSIQKTLLQLASKMDPENDILFFYLTSHGSKDATLSLKQSKLGLLDLKATELSQMLKDLPVKWKVIVISACYSGKFIELLKDDNTLVITAADDERKSFGCSDIGEFTHFGDAYFNQALKQTNDFIKAFDIANDLVSKREKDENRRHSLPQIHSPTAISQQLAKWRNEVNLN